MEWKEYTGELLKKEVFFDGRSFVSIEKKYSISPIVKSSVLMLDNITASLGDNTIFVFPEIQRTFYEFVLGKVLYDITTGKISMEYKPSSFKKGQKLGYNGCVVVFEEYQHGETYDRIMISFKDGNLKVAIPLSQSPVFQTVNTKMVSTAKAYDKAVQERKKNRKSSSGNYLTIQDIADNKTHLNGSVVVVTEIKKATEFLKSTSISNENLSDLLYIAHMNGDGEVNNITSGQMEGNPAIILAADLYSVVNSLKSDIKIKYVIFDISSNSVGRQLDALDQIRKKKIPMICITDIADSFDYSSLRERGFNEWIWDEQSITSYLYSADSTDVVNKKIRNCAKRNVNYVSVGNKNVSNVVDDLYKHKMIIEEQSAPLISCYERLLTISFSLLRNIAPLGDGELQHYDQWLDDCSEKLEKEKRYISEELYDDLSNVIVSLRDEMLVDYQNNKITAIEDSLLKKKYLSVCFVITERQNKEEIKQFWEDWFEKHMRSVILSVMYPGEYEKSDHFYDLTIIAGWLGNRVMRKLIYQYNSENFVILMYSCENRWQKAHTRRWNQNFSASGNKQIIDKSFSSDKIRINTDFFKTEPVQPSYVQQTSVTAVEDEQTVIEELMRKNRYRQYSTARSKESIDAYPVSFVGGLIAFYRTGHRVVVATDIIHQTGSQISQKIPENLKIGDFIVVRDAQKDIIRELADNILEKEGKQSLRKTAKKWKESLQVELLFSDEDIIIQKLRDVGCKRDYATIRNWLQSNDLIIPQNKDDLLYIAKATGDEVLEEKIDEIYAAGKEVRVAHSAAGKELSQRLRASIYERLQGLDEIDPFNIWDPISIQMDDIGNVKILKIIDIGEVESVERTITNRLISE